MLKDHALKMCAGELKTLGKGTVMHQRKLVSKAQVRTVDSMSLC